MEILVPDTPFTDHGEPLTASPVPKARRLGCLAQRFGWQALLFEEAVFSMLARHARDYSGGLWEFYELSNGGFYMALDTEERFRVAVPGNGFEGELSAEAAGLFACAMAYSHLSFWPDGEVFAKEFYLLHDFLRQHPESAALAAALD